MNAPGLRGRHALVTGAGSGIGAAIAHALAEAGATLTLAGRRLEALEATRLALVDPARHGSAVLDVRDAASVAAAVSQAAAARGAIAILVNNAGMATSRPFLKADTEHWREMLDVNLMGCVHGSQAVLPGMLQAGWGRIVNVASTAGLKGYAYVSAYGAAKHAVIGLTRSLALEVATKGVTVNAVCPGYTDTPLLDGAVRNIVDKTGVEAEAARRTLAAHNPQGRLVQPAEVAQAVLWLCAEHSAAITGQAIAVAGGEVM